MSNNDENNITELQAEWLAVLKACEASGQSMVAYAKDNNLTVKDLYTWKKVLVTKGLLPRNESRGFVKAIVKMPVSHIGECRLILPNGIVVIIENVADEPSLMGLLRSVMQL